MKKYNKWGIKLKNLKMESWDKKNPNFFYIGRKNSWMGLEGNTQYYQNLTKVKEYP